MTEVYFHCSDAEHFFADRRSCAMELKEARAHAIRPTCGISPGRPPEPKANLDHQRATSCSKSAGA